MHRGDLMFVASLTPSKSTEASRGLRRLRGVKIAVLRNLLLRPRIAAGLAVVPMFVQQAMCQSQSNSSVNLIKNNHK